MRRLKAPMQIRAGINFFFKGLTTLSCRVFDLNTKSKA
jgi:hypothetical protein